MLDELHASRNTFMNIELHIDELVLHGFERCHRIQIAAAVERELARLLSEQGAPRLLTQGGAIARLDGGAFETRPDAQADVIGMAVARAVYGGLRGGR